MAANSIGNASLVLSTSGGKLSEGLSSSASEIKGFAAHASSHLQGIGSGGGGIGGKALGGLAGFGSKLAGFMRAGPHIAAIATLGTVIYEAIASPFAKLKELGGIQKHADILGLSASQLQGLSKQFAIVGIEAEAVDGVITKMGKNIYDAAGGHGKAFPALQQLGIDSKALATLAPDEQFKAIADSISRLPPGAAQASAALHIFVEQGTALLPVLQKGGQGIQDFIEKQKKSGSVLSDSQFKAAADAQKAWKDSKLAITAVWDGLVNRATLVAAPIVKFIGGAVTKAFALVTPIFEWLSRALERVAIIMERVGEVVMGWFDELVTDSGARAVSLDCSPASDIGFYEVTIKYTSKPFDDGNQSQNPANTDASVAPTSRPWVINFGAAHGTRLLTKDVATGAAVANSTGQPYDPPPEIPSSNLTITVTAYKDLATFDPVNKVLTYQDAINDAALLMLVSPATTTVFPARTLRCNEYKFGSHYEGGVAYWQCDLTLEYKAIGWNPISLLDAGLTYNKSGSLPPQPILDNQGNPVNSPVPLDGAGHPLNAGGVLIYRDFKGYFERNFANILS